MCLAMLILYLRAETASGQLFLFNSTGNKGKKKGLRKFRTTRFQSSSLPSCVCGLCIMDTTELMGLSHFIQLLDTPGSWFPGGILEPIHPRAQREGWIICAVDHRHHRMTTPETVLTRTRHKAPPPRDGPQWVRAQGLGAYHQDPTPDLLPRALKPEHPSLP